MIGDSAQQVADAKRELVRIGVDRLTGAATDHIDTLAGGSRLDTYPVADFSRLARELSSGSPSILDVRQTHEYDKEHIPGAGNIPLHELPDRLDDVPAGPVWVHCGSGYRASIATSVLDRAGIDVVLIDDTFAKASEQGLTAK